MKGLTFNFYEVPEQYSAYFFVIWNFTVYIFKVLKKMASTLSNVRTQGQSKPERDIHSFNSL